MLIYLCTIAYVNCLIYIYIHALYTQILTLFCDRKKKLPPSAGFDTLNGLKLCLHVELFEFQQGS